MNLELSGKDVTPSKMLKNRLESKLSKLEKRLGQNLLVRVRLSCVPPKKIACGIHFQGVGHEYNAHSVSDDMIKAADEAVEKIERQVQKAQDRPESQRRAEVTIRQDDESVSEE
jgi:ribosomal subunit interface protein